jgi:pimeloyl-ACP methyl ester carboxylesterase
MEAHADVDGIKVFYRTEGSGEPVILIHGNGLSHGQWNYNIGPISGSHKIYAPDMPGFGHSDKPDAEYGLSYYVDFLRSFMDSAGIPQASFIGHSFGGAIVAGFATRYPTYVNSLVLSDATGVSKAGTLFNSGFLNILMNMMTVNRKIYCRPLFYNPVSSSLLDEVVLVTDEKKIRKAFLKNCEEISRYDSRYIESLHSITVPTLIIWGRNDVLLPISDAMKYNELISSSYLKLIDECGHLPNVEKYMEFNKLVIDFLSQG